MYVYAINILADTLSNCLTEPKDYYQEMILASGNVSVVGLVRHNGTTYDILVAVVVLVCA